MATGVKLTTAQYVDFGTDNSLGPGATALTLLLTIEPTSDPASLRVIHRWASGEECFLVQGLGSGIIGFLVSGVGGLRGRQTDAVAISSGVRTRLGFRWRADTGAVSIWVNGVSVAVSTWISDSMVTTLNNSVTQMAICREDAEAADGVPGYYEYAALWESALSDADMLAYGTGTAPDGLSGAPGQLYVKLTTSSDVTDLFESNTVTNHGGEWDAVTDPPNATYATDVQLCEGSNGTITPTNTGGAITSSAVASGTLPTGYTLNANGTISKVGASMLAADIGSRTVLVNLTNAGGTQSNAPAPIVITANPPLRHYAASPITKYCAHTLSTSSITNDGGPAVPAAGYALVGSLPGLALNTTTAVLTHDPDLTEWTEGFVALAVTGTSAGGQVGTFPISVRHSFQFTGEGANAGGSDQATVTLHVGGGGAEDSGSIRRSSFGESSFRRGSFRSSSIGRGRPFR